MFTVFFVVRIRPLRIRRLDQTAYRVINLDQGHLPPTLEVERLYRTWKEASNNMGRSAKYNARNDFLGMSGNAGYHLAKLMVKLEITKEVGVKAKVDGKSEDQILDELCEYQHQV